uniref:Ankyrin repeat domain-containing protein SOWAHC-like isoform X1 n=1 Tax=Petromyzon marinus TaxID=7757 RepID=A0AAJ7UBM6_PETMA|nr:ankyrin repeat domain-containing protein SOWAHC-like isoform X1 [Petromyzon marinus]
MAEGGPVLDRVLQFLLAQGGRVRDGELTERFRGFLEEGDPAKRAERCAEWKAALKACAVVKQDKGARFLVLKKKFRHLLGGDAAAGTQGSGGGGEEEDERGESSLPVEAQPHVHDGEEEEEQQQQQQEEVKKMDEEAEPSGDGAELPEVEVKGRGKEVEEAMEVEEKQEVEEVDKEEAIVEAEEMCEQEAPADCRDADPEASLSPSSDGGRVEGGGGDDAWAPPIGGHELVSASSETISEQSEQLQSMCSRAETEQEDVGSVTASSVTSLFVHMQLEPLERKWMRGAAVGCADTLRQLLAQDPSLASHRDFTSGVSSCRALELRSSFSEAT